ncbi:MAG: hypothetical protein ACO3FE_13460, partial [Planctomycetaceae bacterium]
RPISSLRELLRARSCPSDAVPAQRNGSTAVGETLHSLWYYRKFHRSNLPVASRFTSRFSWLATRRYRKMGCVEVVE